MGSITLPTGQDSLDFPGALYGMRVTRDGHRAPDPLFHEVNSDEYKIICLAACDVGLEVSGAGEDVIYKPIVGPDYQGKWFRKYYGTVLGQQVVGMSVTPEKGFTCIENYTNGDAPDIYTPVVQIVSDNEDVPDAFKINAAVEYAAPRVFDLIVKATPHLLKFIA